jgi:hypothetical protein
MSRPELNKEIMMSFNTSSKAAVLLTAALALMAFPGKTLIKRHLGA